MANPIDVTVAKARGMARSIEARREGLVGVFQTLAKQHGEVAALVDRVQGHDAKRAPLWPKIRIELLVHERGELEVVYPALARYAELAERVETHREEADDLARMIDRLESMPPPSSEWGDLFAALARAVVAHATEEENDIFPAALRTIGPDLAKNLDASLEATQKRLRASLEATTH